MDDANIEDQLAKQIEAIKLPSRASYDSKKDSGYGNDAFAHLNVLKLDLSDCPKIVYKYDLVFYNVKPSGDELILHTAMTKANDVHKNRRRKALISLQRIIVDENEDYFKPQTLGTPVELNWRRCCAFDGGCSYYTAIELPAHAGVIPNETWIRSTDVMFLIPGGKGDIRWTCNKVEEIRLDGDNAKSQPALQFIDILTQQKLTRDENHTVMPDATYVDRVDMTRDHKELCKGVVTAAKVVGGDICMQVDSKISSFFPNIALIDYIMKCSGARTEQEIVRFLGDRRASMTFRKELKNLPLTCRHISTRRTFECKGVHTASANECTFMHGEDVTSVADYYNMRYNYRLRFPNLPLVNEKSKGRMMHHAIECLEISAGVKVSNAKMNREAQEQMITKSCRDPRKLVQDLEACRDKAGLNGSNKYLKNFQIKAAASFAQLPCQILHKPGLAGLAGIEPKIEERGNIKFMGGFKFAEPAKPERPIIFLTLSAAIAENDARNLRENLKQSAASYGMKIEFAQIRDPDINGGQPEQLRAFMNEMRGGAAMFFIVTREKMDESHNMAKKLEQELGVVTQLICSATAQSVNKNQRVTAFNVIAKMNQKLGGTNVNPLVPPALKQSNPEAYKRACGDWYNGRMFVGFTLSHAGAQSFADRTAGAEVREPTCVGMAFTLKNAGQRAALSWFQEKRKATIDDITRHFIKALDIYAESTKGKFPKAILVFRKGMSDGELKRAAYEMKQIRQAVREIQKRKGMEKYVPSVQCVVCRANGADKLFFDNGSANVPAGTCLDASATHPDRLEFLIVPHNAIKGTAKTVRCTLVDEKQGREGRLLEFPEIKSITHSMCYLNGVAAGPTRLPVPLSDSEKAAERQMNLFKETMRNGDDDMSVASGGSRGGVVHDGSADFYQRLSDQYAHRFRGVQYYA